MHGTFLGAQKCPVNDFLDILTKHTSKIVILWRPCMIYPLSTRRPFSRVICVSEFIQSLHTWSTTPYLTLYRSCLKSMYSIFVLVRRWLARLLCPIYNNKFHIPTFACEIKVFKTFSFPYFPPFSYSLLYLFFSLLSFFQEGWGGDCC